MSGQCEVEIIVFCERRMLRSTTHTAPRLLIGRAPECDVQLAPLAGAKIADEHAIVHFTGRSCLLEDLNSPGGVFCNGRRVSSHVLQGGDEIVIGPYTLRFVVHEAGAREPAAQPKLRVVPPPDAGAAALKIDGPVNDTDVTRVTTRPTATPGGTPAATAYLEASLAPASERKTVGRPMGWAKTPPHAAAPPPAASVPIAPMPVASMSVASAAPAPREERATVVRQKPPSQAAAVRDDEDDSEPAPGFSLLSALTAADPAGLAVPAPCVLEAITYAGERVAAVRHVSSGQKIFARGAERVAFTHHRDGRCEVAGPFKARVFRTQKVPTQTAIEGEGERDRLVLQPGMSAVLQLGAYERMHLHFVEPAPAPAATPAFSLRDVIGLAIWPASALLVHAALFFAIGALSREKLVVQNLAPDLTATRVARIVAAPPADAALLPIGMGAPRLGLIAAGVVTKTLTEQALPAREEAEPRQGTGAVKIAPEDAGAVAAQKGAVKNIAVRGRFERAEIQKVVALRWPDVRACYERFGDATAAAKIGAAAKITVEWTITRRGQADAVQAKGAKSLPRALLACVESAVDRWAFIKPRRGAVRVVYPFVLKPSAAPTAVQRAAALALADGLRAKGLPIREVRALESLVAAEPLSPSALARLAEAYANAKVYDKAAASYRALLALAPAVVEAWNNLGGVYVALGDTQAALDAYHAGLLYTPDDPDLHYNLGVLSAQTGDERRALFEYGAALRAAPKHAPTLNNLGVLHAALGQSGENELEKATLAQPDFALAHYNLGLVLRQRRDLAGARRALAAAAALDPEMAEIAIARADVDARAGRPRDAAQAAAQADRRAGLANDLRAGLAALEAGRADEAALLLGRAAAQSPFDAAPRVLLAVAQVARGDLARAVDDFEEALAAAAWSGRPRAAPGKEPPQGTTDPASFGARDGSALAVRAALDLAPPRAEARYAFALALTREGKKAAALEALGDALRLRPDYPEALLALKRIQGKM